MDAEKKKKLEHWGQNRRKWYNLYFFAGIGVNFLLYFTKPGGFDPSNSIVWGCFYGLAIPMATLFICVAIHKKIIGL
ncbi:MAG: hypothetical protein U9N77_08125 [Thermodesulfobacteriota bacterium]|nr:hypothetical protein [Thermodesulfobacteriota bacterium]